MSMLTAPEIVMFVQEVTAQPAPLCVLATVLNVLALEPHITAQPIALSVPETVMFVLEAGQVLTIAKPVMLYAPTMIPLVLAPVPAPHSIVELVTIVMIVAPTLV